MIWHDTRVLGTPPAIRGVNVFQVDDTVRLVDAVNWIAYYASNQNRLDRLDIICHGIENYIEDDEANYSHAVGGWGLAMTADYILRGNATALAPLKGLIDVIVLYACSAAYVNKTTQGTWGDGRMLINSIVHQTGSYVIASDYKQYYSYNPINMGPWEGNVNGFDTDFSVTPLNRNDWKLE